MDHQCPTCRKAFATSVTLKRHIEKLSTCSVSNTCNLCKKEFTTSYLLKRHMARKTPCSSVVKSEKSELELRIQLELEKTNRRMKALELKEKNDRLASADKLAFITANLELKQKNDRLITADKLALVAANIELAKFNAKVRKDEFAMQKELEKIKIESRILVIREEEGLKTARKEITPQIINNIEINAVHINIVNNISEKYMLVNELCANVNEMSKEWYRFIEIAFQKDDANILFNKHNNIKEMTCNILQLYLNSRTYPKYHNIFYKKASDEFYGIMRIDDNKKEVRIIDFKTEMVTMLLPPLIKIYKMILSNKPRLSSLKESDANNLQKYEELTMHMKYISSDVESFLKEAKHIFDEENIIGEVRPSRDLFSCEFFSDTDDN